MINLPPYGRKKTFTPILKKYLYGQPVNILEIGCTRKVNNIKGDGYSTPFFSYIAIKTNGSLTSVDVSQENVDTCKKILLSLNLLYPNISILCLDGLSFLQKTTQHFDIIYLDGWDFDDPLSNSAQNHLIAAKLSVQKLKPGGLLLIDDMLSPVPPYSGKVNSLFPTS